MKDVEKNLETYLNTEKHLISCDLYELKLPSGTTYFYTNSDVDISWDGHVYRHGAILISRDKVKLNDRVVVDTLSVTIHADTDDKLDGVPFLKAAHDGKLDRAMLHLRRCFFRGTSVLGVIGLFGGVVEIKGCGGIQLQLTVKAKTSGLNLEFPTRRYYPQGSYTITSDGNVTAGSDQDSCLIAPFVPLKEVLL